MGSTSHGASLVGDGDGAGADDGAPESGEVKTGNYGFPDIFGNAYFPDMFGNYGFPNRKRLWKLGPRP